MTAFSGGPRPHVRPKNFHHPAIVKPAILPFHQLARLSPHFRPWRPVVELLVFGLALVVLQIAGTIIVYVTFMDRFEGSDAFDDFFDGMDLVSSMALLLVNLAVMTPASWLAAKAARRSWGFVWSVAQRIRWNIIGPALRITLIGYALWFVFVVGTLVLAEGTESLALSPEAFEYLAVVWLLVPLQATAEEVVFRGMLPQALGSWIRNPFVCYVLPTLGFTALHTYDWAGLVQVCIFGLCAAFLTYKTGGIEAGIVLHIVNNLAVFSLGAFTMGSGTLDELLEEPPASLADQLGSLVFSTLMSVLLTWLMLRSKKLRAAASIN